ncbi:hypothetical protein [Microbacterium sp.]|uniref:hypothetical protein n=1 Tax=Microbacterium sp. TaxID=51671 RepID=UPI003F9C9718
MKIHDEIASGAIRHRPALIADRVWEKSGAELHEAQAPRGAQIRLAGIGFRAAAAVGLCRLVVVGVARTC